MAYEKISYVWASIYCKSKPVLQVFELAPFGHPPLFPVAACELPFFHHSTKLRMKKVSIRGQTVWEAAAAGHSR
jgi:hypothetical protein